MNIFVDADGCPVVEDVIELRNRTQSDCPVHLIHNRHHELSSDAENVEVVETGDRRDQADHYIYNHTEPGDLVITDDLGLAALVLKRGATVIRFRGDTVHEDDVEHRLMLRHASAKARRAGDHRGSGPPSFDDQDRSRFRSVLQNHLEQSDE